MLMSISRWQSCHFLRLVVSGALLAGLSACESGNPADQSFTLASDSLPTNVVSNSGLEGSDSELSGWSAYTSEGSTAEAIFTVDGDAYHGNNAFKASIVALGENAYDIEGGPVDVPVTAGGTYALVAWAKGTAGSQANFTASLAEAPWTTFAEKPITFEGEWQQVAFNFTLPEDLSANSIRLPVQMNFEGNVGAEIFIDDLQLLTTQAPPPPSAVPVDLVTNGGLEANADTYDNWGASADATNADGTSFSVDSTEFQEGANSFKVSFGTVLAETNPWNVEAGPTNVPVAEGETYTYSAWVKGTAGSKATFNVQLQESPWHTYSGQEIDVTGDWQQVTFEVVIAEASTINDYEGPTTQVRLFVQMGYVENSGGEIYIDNVQLLTAGTEAAELVTNGGLEASATAYDNWGASADATNADGTTFSVSTSDVYEGSNSFMASFGTVLAAANPWNVEAGPTDVPVIEGVTYTYSAWVKGTAGARGTFNVQLQESPWHTYAGESVDLTGDWQQVTFDVEIAEASTIEDYDGPTTAVRLFVQMGYAENSGAEIYFDNFSLKAK